MYTNGINSYTKVQDEKPKLASQNFDFDGESFSELMEKEEPSGGGLRETAAELAEDESILSTDEENKAIAKRNKENAQQNAEAQKPQVKGEEDKARLLRLMEMSNKINMPQINVSKSKKEIENTIGPSIEDQEDQEDITAIVAKLAAMRNNTSDVKNDDVETNISMDKHPEDLEERRKDNSQVLYETEEELKEDASILSTEEENLEMARRNSAMNNLSDRDYDTSQEDMVFLNEIVALNNQMGLEKSEVITNTQNVLNALMSSVQERANRIDLSELNKGDVDCIIDILKMDGLDSGYFTDWNNDGDLKNLSDKFLYLLRDSIINKKVFRIDFDNEISVIIKIDKDGKLSAKFLTNDESVETYFKHNIHLLRQKFEELNVRYGEITYENTNT